MRSLLECKWADFFDRHKEPYEYEPVKLELKSGLYIPDFRIRGYFIEVKPTVKHMLEHMDRFHQAAYLGVVLCVVIGDPKKVALRIHPQDYDSVHLFDLRSRRNVQQEA